jgi:sulfide:quinone oxidoreductase
MAKIIVVGAGFAGQTAALYLGNSLGKDHDITVVNASDQFYYIPSFVWVGTGRMASNKTHFSLEPVYRKFGVKFVHGWAHTIDPENNYILVKPNGGNESPDLRLDYDYILLATGPKLNFQGTPGLGPNDGNSYSICTLPHAEESCGKYLEEVERMRKGENRRIVVGTGHPAATCQGAALEYISNIHKDLISRGIREKAELHWLSNESALGDFGICGVNASADGTKGSAEDFIRAVFKDFDISWEVRCGVTEIDNKKALWQNYEGESGETKFDFSMLIPQFKGQELKVIGPNAEKSKGQLFNPGGFVKVDAIYGQSYPDMIANPDSWPGVYQNPDFSNIFAAGIAFAPPGPISSPHTNPHGLSITAAPPRTGMVSGIIGRICALNIIDLVTQGRMTHSERMTEMAAACIASMGDSLWDGSAATIMIYPVVPNHRKYPNEHGRDRFVTHLEMGLAGAWMKRMIHSTFIHKLQGRPGWKLIPE